MRSVGPWCLVVAIGMVVAAQFRDWMWWQIWGGDEDEPNPAPLLCVLWQILRAVESGWDWILWRKLWPVRSALSRLLWRYSPAPLPPTIIDKDGLTPEDWLLMSIVGLWDMNKYDARFDYDKSVKKNWEVSLKAGETQGPHESASE